MYVLIRRVVALLLMAPAIAFAAPLGYDDARHLLSRSGFAPTEAEVEAFARLDRGEAVDKLLSGTEARARTSPPAWVASPVSRPRDMRDATPEEKRAFQRELFEKSIELREWWLAEMLATPTPLTERMTLFWHNHFATSQQKVKPPQLMYRQNLLLRKNALGNFAVLLHEVAKDPAMLIYLDGVANRKGQPNENFAREVMELFTLGEGHYSEHDIQEAARAFTGWSIDPASASFVFRPRLHDDDEKTILGRTGRFDGDQVLDILLARPECAEFITRKLWREFVSPTPDETEVRRIAAVFRNNHYEIKPLMRAIFTSDAFFAAANRATLVKSPIDLVVGSLRQLQIPAEPLRPAVFATAALGQNLFAPPNVKGWPGGEAWINSSTLLTRKQILEKLFRGEGPGLFNANAERPVETGAAPSKGGGPQARMERLFQRSGLAYRFDAERWLAQFAQGGNTTRPAEKLLLAAAPTQTPSPELQGSARVRALVLDPVYQLK